MVGIVVVSHSRRLAEAAVELASEMAAEARIETAAGLDEHTLGTDATAIAEAVSAADDGDGVVVLMDLGSAILSTELALELLPDPTARDRVLLCPAPLVEGLVAAAVSAASGASRVEVAAEAVNALSAKQSHLTPHPSPDAPHQPDPALRPGLSSELESPPSHGPRSASASGTFTVTNSHGLHARPAARLVTEMRSFDATTQIRNVTTGSAWVPAVGFSRVATLGALRGHEIEITATGSQAEEAVAALVRLAASAFGESASSEPATAGLAASESVASGPTAPKPMAAEPAGFGDTSAAIGKGQPASPGIGIGPAHHRRLSKPDISGLASLGPEPERQRMEEALVKVRDEVLRFRADAGQTTAGIFDAHLLLLDDADLLADVRERIAAGASAPAAWTAATDRVEADFAALTDPYLRARAADVRAVADQVLRAFAPPSPQLIPGPDSSSDSGSEPIPSSEPEPIPGPGPGPASAFVLIAADLTPAEAAALDPARTAGVVLTAGSPTSHSAIIARTRGIPMVTGVGSAGDIPQGAVIAIDGSTGEVGQVTDAWRRRATAATARRERAAAGAHRPALTKDRHRIVVAANIGSLNDAHLAAANGADEAGLVRTEFLFLTTEAPDVDEQEAAYLGIAEALGGRRITLRTLDVGGDKPLPYLPTPREANPFLGVRGLRHSFAHPDLFADQLLAIVRTAHATPVSVMFPMVSTVDEVIRARRMLRDAIARDGRGDPAYLRVGIMVEIPATALKARHFHDHVDFFSVGTNDLTQYALAAERGNPAITVDALDPGVLRLIEETVRGRRPVAVCGELAGDEAAVPLLTALGVRELSVAPPLVAAVKNAVRGLEEAQPSTRSAWSL